MSGKYLLDTNVLINAINRKLKIPRQDYGISVITEMELLSFPKLTEPEVADIQRLLSNFPIHYITPQIKSLTIDLRRRTSVKLPDCIICATAIQDKRVLVTDDRQLTQIRDVEVITLDQLLSGHNASE